MQTPTEEVIPTAHVFVHTTGGVSKHLIAFRDYEQGRSYREYQIAAVASGSGITISGSTIVHPDGTLEAVGTITYTSDHLISVRIISEMRTIAADDPIKPVLYQAMACSEIQLQTWTWGCRKP